MCVRAGHGDWLSPASHAGIRRGSATGEVRELATLRERLCGRRKSAPHEPLVLVRTVAWTASGDSVGGDASQFRPTAYAASLDSLRLFCIEGTSVVELPLPLLHRGASDHPNRLVSLAPANRAGITIPASVKELRADVVMTFRHRETGRTETKVFTLRMFKRERTTLEPILE